MCPELPLAHLEIGRADFFQTHPTEIDKTEYHHGKMCSMANALDSG